MRIAADLGSDVPFSLMGGTALGTGRGERLTELPTTGTFHWAFAMADGGLSTPSGLRRVRPPPRGDRSEVAWPRPTTPSGGAARR